MKTSILKILRSIATFTFALWIFLTVIVLIATVHRWMNPGFKSISNLDYYHYSLCTLGAFVLIASIFLIKKLSSSENRSH